MGWTEYLRMVEIVREGNGEISIEGLVNRENNGEELIERGIESI